MSFVKKLFYRNVKYLFLLKIVAESYIVVLQNCFSENWDLDLLYEVFSSKVELYLCKSTIRCSTPNNLLDILDEARKRLSRTVSLNPLMHNVPKWSDTF